MTENIVSGIQLEDGYIVETVYYGSGTLCISSQVGCAVRCPFCASGMNGLMRNLTIEEMRAQVQEALSKGYDIKRVTISGIGEPLHNFDVVKQFISEVELPVSITTTGAKPEKLEELFCLNHNGIMLSLHGGTSETHSKLVPVAEGFDSITDSFDRVWQNLSRNKKRKTGFNYMMLKGHNDSYEELKAYVSFAKQYPEAVTHLLVCNDVEGSNYESVPDERLQEVYIWMKNMGLNVRRANSWRREREGGCGTLLAQKR